MKSGVVILFIAVSALIFVFAEAGRDDCRGYGCGSCCQSDEAQCCDMGRYCSDFPAHVNCRTLWRSTTSTLDEDATSLSNEDPDKCLVNCANYGYMNPKDKQSHLPICSCTEDVVNVQHLMKIRLSENSLVCAQLQDMYGMSDTDNAAKKVKVIARKCHNNRKCVCLLPEEIPELFRERKIIESPIAITSNLPSVQLNCGDVVKIKGYHDEDPFLTYRGLKCKENLGEKNERMRCGWFHNELSTARQQWKIICERNTQSEKPLTLRDRFGLQSVFSNDFIYIAKHNVKGNKETLSELSTFKFVAPPGEKRPLSSRIMTGEPVAFFHESSDRYIGQNGVGLTIMQGNIDTSSLLRIYKDQ